MKKDFLFTSESVTEGHPDKICDQIADAVLDEAIKGDPNSRVACEVLTKTGFVLIAGEITTSSEINYEEVARKVIKEIGYTSPELGLDAETCGVLVAIGRQSEDIARGVVKSNEEEQGAGDQGLMFGYACRETYELMPLPIMLAHRIAMRLADVRKNGEVDFIRPDGKTQVTVRYEDGIPRSVETVVVSTQHSPDVRDETLKEYVVEEIVKRVISPEMLSPGVKYYVNPTGRFVTGGPKGDCGLTGRKIMVDTYGGYSRHGGGAFSGKDPSKVDRSASYMARYIAKNVVGAGIAERCEIQLAYVIGVPEPVSIYVETFGTGKVDEERIAKVLKEIFRFRPAHIIKDLELLKPIYRKTSVYGHFGREEEDFKWERKDKVEELKEMLL